MPESNEIRPLRNRDVVMMFGPLGFVAGGTAVIIEDLNSPETHTREDIDRQLLPLEIQSTHLSYTKQVLVKHGDTGSTAITIIDNESNAIGKQIQTLSAERPPFKTGELITYFAEAGLGSALVVTGLAFAIRNRWRRSHSLKTTPSQN